MSANDVADIVILVGQAVIAGLFWWTLRRQRRNAAALQRLGRRVDTYNDQLTTLYERQRELAGDFASLSNQVAEMQGLRDELQRHTTSNLLHAERTDGQ